MRTRHGLRWEVQPSAHKISGPLKALVSFSVQRVIIIKFFVYAAALLLFVWSVTRHTQLTHTWVWTDTELLLFCCTKILLEARKNISLIWPTLSCLKRPFRGIHPGYLFWMFGHNILIPSSSYNLSWSCALLCLIHVLISNFQACNAATEIIVYAWDQQTTHYQCFYSDLFCLFVYSMPVENIYNLKKSFPPLLPLSSTSSSVLSFICAAFFFLHTQWLNIIPSA